MFFHTHGGTCPNDGHISDIKHVPNTSTLGSTDTLFSVSDVIISRWDYVIKLPTLILKTNCHMKNLCKRNGLCLYRGMGQFSNFLFCRSQVRVMHVIHMFNAVP